MTQENKIVQLMRPIIYMVYLLIASVTTAQFGDGDGPTPIEDPRDGGSGGVSVSFTGPGSANVNDYDYYYVNVSGGYHYSTSYYVNGGSIVSQSKTRVRVRWTSTGTRYVRANIRVGSVNYTKYKYVSVSCPTLYPGSITNTQTVCYNGDPSTIGNSSSASGGGGISYQWQYSYNGSNGWTNVLSARSSTYNPPGNQTSTKYYRRRAQSCGQTKYTNSIKITVQPNITVYPINGGGNICSGSSAQIAISGTHPLVYYQVKRNGSNYGAAKKGTGGTMGLGNYTQSGTYTVVGKIGSCSKSMSGSVTINVSPVSNKGSISTSSSRCGTGTHSFTLSGHTGTIQRWQMRYRNGSGSWTGWSLITETDNVTTVSPTLSYWSGGNRIYEVRALVKSGVCGATYAYKQATVHPNVSSGSISGNQTICYNGNPSNLGSSSAASGANGSYTYTWQYSPNGSSSWTNIGSSNSTSYNPPSGLKANRWYRRRVSSCGQTAYSNAVKVTVNSALSAGAINGAKSICYNASAGTLGSSTNASGGGSGLKYQWQYSTNGTNFTNISGATSSNYSPGNLTATRWYRRGASTTTCSWTYTGSVKITVNSDLVAGAINGAKTICHNTSAGTLGSVTNASGGGSGLKYQWQYSTNGTNFTNISGATSSAYSPGNLTTTRWYRRGASTTTCSWEYTGSVKVTVTSDLNVGAINGTKTICYDGPAGTLGSTTNASGGGSGIKYQWQSSSNGSNFTNISSATNSTYSPGNLTATRWYRRGASTTTCNWEYTSSTKVTVLQDLTAGSISGNQTLCFGENPSQLSNAAGASGGTSRIYNWEKSTIGATSGFVPIGSTNTAFYTPPVTNETTWYRRKVTSGSGCGEEYTSAVKVEYYGDLNPGTIAGGQNLCFNETPLVINSTGDAYGGDTPSYQWEESTSGPSGPFTLVVDATSNTFTPPVNNQTTWYRRTVISGSGCGSMATNVVKIGVDPATVAGTMTASLSTVCGSQTGDFTLSGHTGTIKHWQFRFKDGTAEYSAWTKFEQNENITSVSYDFSQWDEGIRTYQIRARVQSGVCDVKYPKKTIVVNPAPSTFSVTGGGNYCDGEPGIPVGLDGSWLNVNYQLKRDGANQTLLAGTGSVLDFGVLTAEGNYTIEATHVEGGCVISMTGSAVIDRLELPGIFTVQGGGTYCSGENGVIVSLSNSASGINYELLRNGASTGVTKSGSGGVLSFGYQTTAGEYSVQAINASTSCVNPMSGSATVQVKELPGDASIASVDYGFEGSTITRGNPPVDEAWYWQSTAEGVDESDDSPFILVNDPGTYYLRAKKDNGCWSSAVFVTFGAVEPTSVTAATASNESLQVAWSEVVDAEGYKISRSQGGSEEYAEIYTAPAGTTTYLDQGLETGTTYNYRIQTIVNGQLSAAIQVASATTSGEFNGDESLTHEPVHNGNISAIRWKGTNDESEQLFAYNYDGLNRLLGARYAAKESSAYNNNNGHFSVPSISYDLNGNIQSLTRQGSNQADNSDIIDELTYNYGVGGSNQLKKVSDTRGDSGFKDGSNSGNDYQYDKNGNMIVDHNKDIVAISYNHLNLPERVEFQNGDYIIYEYDAVGIKLSQLVYRAGESIAEKRTDYVGKFIYETKGSDARKLQLIQHEEGRIVSTDEGLLDYQYHLKDHLGNARVTFSTTPVEYVSMATMEDLGEATDYELWAQTSRSGSPSGNSSAHVMRLNTDEMGDGTVINGVAGLRSMFSVQKGDVLDLSVKAYYEMIPSDNGSFLGNSLFAMILTGSTGGNVGSAEGGGVQSTNLDQSVLDAIQGTKDQALDNSVPRAYLNYVLFDEELNYVASGFKQISGAAYFDWEEVVLDAPIEIEKEGYVLIYISNETRDASVVDFDDLTITHTKTNVVQSDDYYPFGLTFNGYQRVASTVNRFNTFQDQERDETTGWIQFKWRNHNPEIGRFFNVDPLAMDYVYNSPYAFSENNVIVHIELEGLEKVYIFDQASRPQDNGTPGTSYTASIYVQHDNGRVTGPFSGSTYPNSISPTDNGTNHNTISEGTHNYNNGNGHTPASTLITEKGLNIDDGNDDNENTRTTLSIVDVIMTSVNAHEGTSDNGNFNSRGSQGCITICPSDIAGFFDNFIWNQNADGSDGATGTSSGIITIYRGNSNESDEKKAELEKTLQVLSDIFEE